MKNHLLTIFFTLVFLSANNVQGQFELPQETFGAFVTWGTVWGDYNNDGYTDLYLSNGLAGYAWEGFLYKNNGDGTFNKIISSDDIVSETYTSGGSSWGDFDNDGYLDLYIANVYPGSGTSPSPNSLHTNDGDGTFTKATTTSHGDIVKTQTTGTGTLTWLDYNNDGLLDAATSNGRVFPETASNNFLYMNNGSPAFDFSEVSNVFTTSGVTLRAGITSADFDEDGDVDVFVASGNEFNNNLLYKNTGSPNYNFTSNTVISSVPAQSGSWGDYDNDGDLDLYIANGGFDGGAAATNSLFRNNSGTLTEITSGVGPIITDTDFSYTTAFGDYDNDGDLDLFVGNDGDYDNGYRVRLYDNNGSGVFTSNTTTNVTINNDFIRSAAWADFDNDGDIDLMLGREGNNRLYENNGNSNNWAELKLIGDGLTTNSNAIGSLVKLNTTINSSNYTQVRDVTSQSGSGSHNDLRVHFGLGDANDIETLTIKWLGSGATSTYSDLPSNKIMHAKQGALNVSSNIIKAQNFMYLFGNTGGSIEFTTADADGGSLTMLRTDSDPGGTFGGITSATTPGGSTITASAVYPDKFWTVTPTSLTGFTSTVYFDASSLTGSPDLDDVILMKRANNSSDWVALNTNRIGNTLYSSGITSFSEFAIGYEESGVLVETKIFIEGAYDTNLNEMTTTLNPTDIPLTSPYSEDERTVSSVPANVVDWVLVQLRLTDSGVAEASTSAFLHKDGRIVADDGTTGQIELDAPAGSYYIVVKHRNHLSVMSAGTELLNSSTTTLYDFTTGSEQFFGTNGAKQIDN